MNPRITDGCLVPFPFQQQLTFFLSGLCVIGTHHRPAALAASPSDDPLTVRRMPGLVAFWTFGEEPGQPRLSEGTLQSYPLAEVGGPVARYAVGSMLDEAMKGRLGGLAVFNRALTGAEIKKLHAASRVDLLKQYHWIKCLFSKVESFVPSKPQAASRRSNGMPPFTQESPSH
jgi:hypothetical protein